MKNHGKSQNTKRSGYSKTENSQKNLKAKKYKQNLCV